MGLNELKEKLAAVRELSDDELESATAGFSFNLGADTITVTLAPADKAAVYVGMYMKVLPVTAESMLMVNEAVSKLDGPDYAGKNRVCLIHYVINGDVIAVTGYEINP